MAMNIYLAAHPLTNRMHADEILDHLKSLDISPPYSGGYYSIVAFGAQSGLTPDDLQKRLLLALPNRGDIFSYLINYCQEFHRATSDNRQIYAFRILRPKEDGELRGRRFLELASLKDTPALRTIVPGLYEAHIGLTLWRLNYPRRRDAEKSLETTEEYLKSKNLQTVSRIGTSHFYVEV